MDDGRQGAGFLTEKSLQRMNLDGGERTTIVNDPDAWITGLARCGDRYLVLSWAFHGGTNQIHIWRTNADGSKPDATDQRTFLLATWFASPDAKWVYYFDGRGSQENTRCRRAS